MMWKKVLLASAVTGLLAGVAIPIHSTPADAARSGCHKAAKARFPHDHKAAINSSIGARPSGNSIRRRTKEPSSFSLIQELGEGRPLRRPSLLHRASQPAPQAGFVFVR